LGNLKRRDHAEDLGIYGRIILDYMLGIHLAQDRDQWQALVNKSMNL
jgi:hypothetical protein